MSSQTATSPVLPVASATPVAPSTAAGLGMALLSAASFGVSGSFAKALLDSGWSPGAAVVVRLTGAAAVMIIPTLLLLRAHWGVLRRNAGLLIGYGIVGAAGVQVCYFNAIRHLPVGVALLLEYLSPILIVGWLWLTAHLRPRRLTVVGASLAVAGLVLVLDLTGTGSISITGVLWALGAAVTNATYFIMAARKADEIPPVVMVGVGMVLGTVTVALLGLVGVLPLVFATNDTLVAGVRTSWLVPALAMVLLATVVAYLTGIVAARRLGSKVASFLALTEVLFAVLAAWLMLGEVPSAMQLGGGVLIVAGVVCVRLDDLRSRGTGPDGEQQIRRSRHRQAGAEQVQDDQHDGQPGEVLGKADRPLDQLDHQ